MKKVGKIFAKVVIIAILLAFGAVVADVMIVANLSTEENLVFSNFTGLNALIVTTSSMEGGHDNWSEMYDNHINAGDGIIIKRVDSPNQINVGDVITFYKEQGEPPIIHRVIAKDKVKGVYEFHTRGDANNTPDNGVVEEDKVVGKYLFRIPKLGLFVQNTAGFVMKYKIVFICIIGIIMAFIAICAVYRVASWINKGN